MKDASNEFKTLLSMFTRFFDLIHQPITIIDKDGNFIYYNQESADIDGYNIESALGKHVLEVYTALPADKSTLLKALNDGTEFIGNYQIYYNHKGKAVEFQHTTVPVYGSNGEIEGVIEIGRDMTAVKLLQDQVVELNNLLYSRNLSEHHEIITADPAMLKLIVKAKRLALNDVPIMIVGETGTGKELFARLIHNTSDRSKKPFIALNCGAIPPTLIESTLFGTAKGAFTGAENKKGYLELADGGTLFLDELNSMPIELQSKLLRFCQDKTFWKLGGTEEQKSDIRIITALNESPAQLIKNKRLRSDLYYRLCIGHLVLPSLNTRSNDIALLARHFIEKHSNIIKHQINGITDEAVSILKLQNWPGNVRMLENVIVRSMLLQEQGGPLNIIAYDEEVLAPVSFSSVTSPEHEINAELEIDAAINGLARTVENFERQLIVNALNESKGKVSQAADKLKISRTTLHYKVKKYGIQFCVSEAD